MEWTEALTRMLLGETLNGQESCSTEWKQYKASADGKNIECGGAHVPLVLLAGITWRAIAKTPDEWLKEAKALLEMGARSVDSETVRQLVQMIDARKADWSNEKPTEPGWYWVRSSTGHGEHVVCVSFGPESVGLVVTSNGDQERLVLSTEFEGCQWLGPISPDIAQMFLMAQRQLDSLTLAYNGLRDQEPKHDHCQEVRNLEMRLAAARTCRRSAEGERDHFRGLYQTGRRLIGALTLAIETMANDCAESAEHLEKEIAANNLWGDFKHPKAERAEVLAGCAKRLKGVLMSFATGQIKLPEPPWDPNYEDQDR